LKEALSANIDSSPTSPPLSAFINRRPLDSRTEAHLHASCAAIVKGYPAEPEAELNFDSLHKTTGSQNPYHAPVPAKDRSQSNSHLPEALPSTTRPHTHSSKVDSGLRTLAPASKSVQDLALVSAFRRHEQQQAIADSQDSRRLSRRTDFHAQRRSLTAAVLPKAPMDRPRTAPAESSNKNFAIPRAASTDQQFVHASTARTSVAITPARISTRASKHLILDPDSYQAAISEADTEATKWMHSKFEKIAVQSQPAETPQPPRSRSLKRGWSLRSELREYVRPLTSSGSRPASRDRGDRSSISRKPSGNVRSASAQGWRSWSLQRKSSKSSLVEPPSMSSGAMLSSVPVQTPYQGPLVNQRKEIDLNRELPPLPSIDTWQEPQSQPPPGLHIASLMRTKSKAQSRKSVARKTLLAFDPEVIPPAPIASAPSINKSSSIRNTTIFKSSESFRQQPTDHIADSQYPVSTARKSMGAVSSPEHVVGSARKSTDAHSKTSSSDSCFSPAPSTSPGHRRSLDLNRAAEPVKSVETFQQSTSSLSYKRRPSDATTAPTTRPMTRDSKAPNFSRKISVDNNGRIHEAHVSNVVEVTALPPMPAKKQNFASLRKVLSKFDLKSGKPMNWMDKFEADGIKAGILVHNKESPVAVVRY
jgi:hypothetical protein